MGIKTEVKASQYLRNLLCEKEFETIHQRVINQKEY